MWHFWLSYGSVTLGGGVTLLYVKRKKIKKKKKRLSEDITPLIIMYFICIIRVGHSHRPYQDSRAAFVAAGACGLLGLAVEVGSRDWSACTTDHLGLGEALLWRVGGGCHNDGNIWWGRQGRLFCFVFDFRLL